MRPVLANLGFILQINGVLLVGPIALGFYLDESRALNAFFVTAIVSFVSGFVLNALCERKELNFKQSCELLFASYFCLSLVGSIPYFYLNVFRTEDWILRFTNSFFESVSGFTTTGFSLIRDLDALASSLIFYRSMTQWIGGIGIIFILLSFFYSNEEITQFVRALGVERILRNLKTLLPFILLVYTLYLIVFAPLLYFSSIGDSIEAISFVFSTLTTGGFSPMNDVSKLANRNIGFILGLLMVIGAANFKTHYWILNRRFRRAVSAEFALFLFIIAGGTVMMYMLTGLDPYTALFHTVSASSTTGFSFIDLSRLNSNAKLMLTLLMMIGGCSFSTAGGVKILRLMIMFKAVPELVKRVIWDSKEPMKVDGFTREEVVYNLMIPVALVVLVGSGTMIFFASGYGFVDSLFEVTAAVATTGLSVGIVNTMLPLGLKWLMTLLMILGRIEVVPLMVALGLWIGRVDQQRAQ